MEARSKYSYDERGAKAIFGKYSLLSSPSLFAIYTLDCTFINIGLERSQNIPFHVRLKGGKSTKFHHHG